MNSIPLNEMIGRTLRIGLQWAGIPERAINKIKVLIMLGIHASITSFLVILLYPVLVIGCRMMSATGDISLTGMTIDYIFLSIGTFIFSLPSFLMACFLLKVIVNASFTIPARFCLWLLTLSLLSFLETFIANLVDSGGSFQPVTCLPPLLAVACITLFRYKQFVKLFQAIDHETQLV